MISYEVDHTSNQCLVFPPCVVCFYTNLICALMERCCTRYHILYHIAHTHDKREERGSWWLPRGTSVPVIYPERVRRVLLGVYRGRLGMYYSGFWTPEGGELTYFRRRMSCPLQRGHTGRAAPAPLPLPSPPFPSKSRKVTRMYFRCISIMSIVGETS